MPYFSESKRSFSHSPLNKMRDSVRMWDAIQRAAAREASLNKTNVMEENVKWLRSRVCVPQRDVNLFCNTQPT